MPHLERMSLDNKSAPEMAKSRTTEWTTKRETTLTPFGVLLRKIRIDKDMTMAEMAAGIGYSASILSAVENGRQAISNQLFDAIVKKFGDSIETKKQLSEARSKSSVFLKIDLRRASPLERKVCFRLADRHELLTPDQLLAILEILG